MYVRLYVCAVGLLSVFVCGHVHVSLCECVSFKEINGIDIHDVQCVDFVLPSIKL